MDQSPTLTTLSQQAISAALEGRFEDALKLNKEILKEDQQNVDALNRLGRACMELGKTDQAKKFYNQVLKIDPYNPIATKNLKIIKAVKGNHNGGGFEVIRVTPSLFLQEPGKTKVVSLLKIAEPQKLSRLYCGMPIKIVVKNHRITCFDSDDEYLGVLPDDICHSLIRLIKGGNKYDVYVKSVKVNGLSVLIRETKRSPRFKNQPSFLENNQPKVSEIIPTLTDQQDDLMDEEIEEGEEESI